MKQRKTEKEEATGEKSEVAEPQPVKRDKTEKIPTKKGHKHLTEKNQDKKGDP